MEGCRVMLISQHHSREGLWFCTPFARGSDLDLKPLWHSLVFHLWIFSHYHSLRYFKPTLIAKAPITSSTILERNRCAYQVSWLRKYKHELDFMPALTDSRGYSTRTILKQKAAHEIKQPQGHYSKTVQENKAWVFHCPVVYLQSNNTIHHSKNFRTIHTWQIVHITCKRFQEQAKGSIVKLVYFPFVIVKISIHLPHHTGESRQCYCTSRTLPRSLRRIPPTTGTSHCSWLEVIETR